MISSHRPINVTFLKDLPVLVGPSVVVIPGDLFSLMTLYESGCDRASPDSSLPLLRAFGTVWTL